MNYQEFLSEVRTHLAAYVEPGAVLQVKSMPRNNGTHYDGLVIMHPERNISPTIYLTPYYHRYLCGVDMEDIYSDILSSYRYHLPEQNFDTRQFTDFSNVRSKLVMRLVNYARNQDMLRDVPHVCFQDLAIVFYCLLYADESNHASILVHNEHLKMWGVDCKTVHALAEKNTPGLLPAQIMPMQEFLSQFPTHELTGVCDGAFPMLVLSNRYRTNGAGALLYEGLLADVAVQLDSNLLILPSSIHETILLPAIDDSGLEDACRIVREINETELADEEVLADHAYFYDRETKLIHY